MHTLAHTQTHMQCLSMCSHTHLAMQFLLPLCKRGDDFAFWPASIGCTVRLFEICIRSTMYMCVCVCVRSRTCAGPNSIAYISARLTEMQPRFLLWHFALSVSLSLSPVFRLSLCLFVSSRWYLLCPVHLFIWKAHAMPL